METSIRPDFRSQPAASGVGVIDHHLPVHDNLAIMDDDQPIQHQTASDRTQAGLTQDVVDDEDIVHYEITLPPGDRVYDTMEKLDNYFARSPSDILRAVWNETKGMVSPINIESNVSLDGFERYYADWDEHQDHATFWATELFLREKEEDPRDYERFGFCVDQILSWNASTIARMMLVTMFVQYNEVWEEMHYPGVNIPGVWSKFCDDLDELKARNRPEEQAAFSIKDRVHLIHHPFELPFEKSFQSDYLDPHGAVDFYAGRLASNAESWKIQGRQMWDGPYTSLASSSSTGKTRFLKELAIRHIPTVYMCLRGEEEAGYPKSTIPGFAHRYCVDPPGDKFDWEWPFIAFVTGILAGIDWLLDMVQRATDPAGYREVLWYVLAEWDTKFAAASIDKYLTSEISENEHVKDLFWFKLRETVENGGAAIVQIEREYENPSIVVWQQQKSTIQDFWSKIESRINGICTQEYPFLLFAWDEARNLVRQKNGNDFNNNFQRIVRAIDKITRETECRIFNIFCGTTSHLEEFTLHPFYHDIGMFEPIINLPTFDYHAKYYLDATLDPEEVAVTDRILHFGRMAWLSYFRNGANTQQLMELAAFKLTLTHPEEYDRLFGAGDDRRKVVPAMIALLACRLALHIGSYVSLVRDLVASHMMMPLTLADDRHQLQATFLPNPFSQLPPLLLLQKESGWSLWRCQYVRFRCGKMMMCKVMYTRKKKHELGILADPAPSRGLPS